MKGWSTVLAALALTLSLLLATCFTRAKAEVRPSIQVQHSLPSSKKTTSSSPQALKDLRAKNRKNLSKKVDSSFRRIPPSKSNPTQNKFNPPAYGGKDKTNTAISELPVSFLLLFLSFRFYCLF